MCKSFVKPLVEVELRKSANIQDMEALQAFEKLARSIGDDELAQSITTAMHHRMESSQAMRLSNAIKNEITSMSDVSELLAAWRAAKHSEGVHGHARDCFVEGRPMLMRFLCSEISSPGSNVTSMAPAVELAKTYISDKAIVDPDPAVADSDRKAMTAVLVWSQIVLKVKDALGASVENGPSSAAARALLSMYMSAQHHKGSKKHIGFEGNVQESLNIVTAYLSNLEKGDDGVLAHLKVGGQMDMQQSGEALLALAEQCRLVAGLSAEGDGKRWYEAEPWPEDEASYSI
jgi:hypothetical protein